MYGVVGAAGYSVLFVWLTVACNMISKMMMGVGSVSVYGIEHTLVVLCYERER